MLGCGLLLVQLVWGWTSEKKLLDGQRERESGAQYDPMMNYTGKINDWTKAVHRPVADREIQARGGGAAMTVMTTSYS